MSEGAEIEYSRQGCDRRLFCNTRSPAETPSTSRLRWHLWGLKMTDTVLDTVSTLRTVAMLSRIISLLPCEGFGPRGATLVAHLIQGDISSETIDSYATGRGLIASISCCSYSSVDNQ